MDWMVCPCLPIGFTWFPGARTWSKASPGSRNKIQWSGGSMFIIYWLLVLTILKNMTSSMGRIIPYNYYGKKCLKPPTSIIFISITVYMCFLYLRTNQKNDRFFLKCNVEHRSIMDMQTRFWSLTLRAVAGPKANLSLVSKCSVGWICCENKTCYQRIVIFQVWYGSK